MVDYDKEFQFSIEEDDGEDLVTRKVTIEELEEEEEKAKPVLTKAERKIKEKKQNKRTLIICGSIVGVVAIVGVFFAIFGRKTIERILPFALNGLSAEDLAEEDLVEGEWYVANNQAYGFTVEVIELCNMYDKPNARGNVLKTFQIGDNVLLLGECYNTKTNEMLNWFYIQTEGKKGYIKRDNIDMIWETSYIDYEDPDVETNDNQNAMDEVDEKYYQEYFVQQLDNVNETAEENQKNTERYMYLVEMRNKLNRQIRYSVAYMEDEYGDEYEVYVEYTDADIANMQNQLNEINKEIETLR